MRLVIFTGNAPRHKFVANTLLARAADALAVSECKSSARPPRAEDTARDPIARHFAERFEAEQAAFPGEDFFRAPTLPLTAGDVNEAAVAQIVARFRPDAAVVYGASIIREPLLSLVPVGRFINMHLGLSPYYRGSGTNFWPFVNGELQFVGATLLHLDAGIDTGDIIAHVRAPVEPGDTAHTFGNRTIRAGAAGLVEVLLRLARGEVLPRVPQWREPGAKYYRRRDFTEEALARYRARLADGLSAAYAARPSFPPRFIGLDDPAPERATREK